MPCTRLGSETQSQYVCFRPYACRNEVRSARAQLAAQANPHDAVARKLQATCHGGQVQHMYFRVSMLRYVAVAMSLGSKLSAAHLTDEAICGNAERSGRQC
jgi:hypothetical protein